MMQVDSATPVTTSVVLVTASEPEPRSFGKQVVMGGLLDHLCARLGPDNVHVILIGRSGVRRPETPYRLHLIPKPRALEQMWAVVRRVLLPPRTSLQEAALWAPRVRKAVESRLSQIAADLEIWDTIRTGQYAGRRSQVPRVLYADDLFSRRYASMIERIENDAMEVANPLGDFATMLPGPVAAWASRPAVYLPLLRFERGRVARSENRAPAQFDATLLVNADEAADLAERTGSDRVRTVLPLLPEPSPRPRRFDGTPTFVFLGGLDYPPNMDGLIWFLTNCREPVLSALPGFRLLLVGKGSDRPLPEAESWGEHVTPLGWVEDLDDVLRSAAALLSPLRIGSGTKIKVLESLSRGLPVVATAHGVLGLDVDRGDGCLLGTTPYELATLMAEATVADVNATLSAAAQTSWDRRFSPEIVGGRYDDVLNLSTSSSDVVG